LQKVTASNLCRVEDGDGHFYEAEDIEPLTALETAQSKCALAARDPTSCRQAVCVPAQ
jgi:hypothetical protein